MAALRWVLAGIAAVAGGFLGYKLTVSWSGVAIGMLCVAIATNRLFAGEWVTTLFVLCAGMFALFQLLGSGAAAPAPYSADTTPMASRAEAAPGATPGGTEPATPQASGADAAQRPASDAVAPVTSAMDAGQVFRDCAHCPDMVVLPAGQFDMGSAANAPGADASEGPQHTVLVRGFAMGQDVVTRAQFADFVKATRYQTDAERLGGCIARAGDTWGFQAQRSWRDAGFAQTDDHPAVCVSWNDAQAYVAWLATITNGKYRLPSEAEWEYAARAGSTGAYWWGDTASMEQANFLGTPTGKTAWRQATVPIKQFAANPFGLYNVHGNVWEWVQDCQHNNYKTAPINGEAWTTRCASTRRGARGGDWLSPPSMLRSARRSWFEPDLPSFAGGFRIALDLKGN